MAERQPREAERSGVIHRADRFCKGFSLPLTRAAALLPAALLAACATPPALPGGSSATAPPLPTVASVHDGDTLTLSTGARIRLAEVDAPETCQPGGDGARAALVALCHGQPAEVTPVAIDRYGRTVARMACRGADSGAALVSGGWAWVYRAYAPANSPLYSMEATARAAGAGLWASPAPIPPWQFRRERGPCR